MPDNYGGQVQLSKLIFTLNWEDPTSDETVLNPQKGDTIFTITSGGCNTLGLLRFKPDKIYCLDINPAQTYLMELRQAAFRRLDYETMIGFFGLTPLRNRISIYEQLKNDLSEEAKAFWSNNMSLIANGLHNNGRYEKFIKIAGRMVRLLQGANNTKDLFKLTSLQQQTMFYDSKWNTKRWRFIFKLMFNKKRLAKKGLNADYFHFDDGSNSFSESFYKRAENALTNIPSKPNYFLSLYLLGRYFDEAHVPEYLLKKNFKAIKENIDRIVPVTADAKYWLEGMPAETFDGLSLSNICELMNLDDTKKLFEEVYRTAKPGAGVCFRNLMIPRDVPETLAESIVKDQVLSQKILKNDRSFVYGKVAGYKVKKTETPITDEAIN